MHDGSGRIEVRQLSKNFGSVQAVANLSFTVEPGSVTGFLGPNGAGKTTTLRMILGLVTPSEGTATINGLPHDKLGNPARVVGSVLENEGFHPKRTARNHLKVYAAAIGVPDQRVDDVLTAVGLTEAGDRHAGGFSLGMRQRLALATALLGDPQVLVLDEPANGLDPEGIAWLRGFLRDFAKQGRTVLVSSHLLAEVEQTIDQVVIISHGQTMYYGQLDDLRNAQRPRVLVLPSDQNALTRALREERISEIEPADGGRLAVMNTSARQVGDIALRAGVAIYGLEERHADLENLFFQLTSGQYTAAPPQHQQYGQEPGAPYGGQPGAPYQAPPPGTPYGAQPYSGYGSPQDGWPQQGAVPTHPPQQPYQQDEGNTGWGGQR
ncbi:ABC transporter ATP-binding protein [Haloechinothrix salitolerans]|uniref:ATP-binding cassette domain-containing protein n=1 Tax=Haloechinothrix salitolerans TaxID=926830 RepID=A0ABW2BWT8_9PSEU